MEDAYIYDAVRSPRAKGKASGAFYEMRPIDLLAQLLSAVEVRNKLDTALVEDIILGCVTPVDDQGANIAKAAALYAGWDDNVAGMQINRFCASGLEAVNLAAMKIRSGWSQLLLAGGVESMSRVPMESDGGALLFDPDVLWKTHYVPQGISADLIATRQAYSREQLDQYAVSSQQKAANAQKNGYFDASIIPIKDQNGLVVLDKDEYLRPATTLAVLEKLSPVFERVGRMGFDAIALRKYPEVEQIRHVHTAGNSSGIVDGAALVLLGSEAMGRELNTKARARIVAASVVGSEPTIMLEGPALAARKVLQLAGMQVSDIDLWEMNEAFASPVLKFRETMDISEDIVNVKWWCYRIRPPFGCYRSNVARYITRRTGASRFNHRFGYLMRRRRYGRRYYYRTSISLFSI